MLVALATPFLAMAAESYVWQVTVAWNFNSTRPDEAGFQLLHQGAAVPDCFVTDPEIREMTCEAVFSEGNQSFTVSVQG